MAKGKTYPSERVHFRDARTGTPILQITNFPTISWALSYAVRTFTPDSRRFLFLSQRAASRDAPFDVFRVDTDGSNLVQLTESEGLSGYAMSLDGSTMLFMRGGSLWTLDLETFSETEIGHYADGCAAGGVLSPDGQYYYSSIPREGERTTFVRFATDGSTEPIATDWPVSGACVHSADPGGSGVLCYHTHKTKIRSHSLIGRDLENLGEFEGSHRFAHISWLGSTGKVQGCALPPDRALLMCALDDLEPTVITQGPYFWHSCGLPGADWIIADTNWPDRGLQLVHVPTGRYAPLCYPESTESYPQWTHPHPQFSPDGRHVLYNSDRRGISQVYMAVITDEFRAHVAEGKLDGYANRR
jgi:hypothetical protein